MANSMLESSVRLAQCHPTDSDIEPGDISYSSDGGWSREDGDCGIWTATSSSRQKFVDGYDYGPPRTSRDEKKFPTQQQISDDEKIVEIWDIMGKPDNNKSSQHRKTWFKASSVLWQDTNNRNNKANDNNARSKSSGTTTIVRRVSVPETKNEEFYVCGFWCCICQRSICRITALILFLVCLYALGFVIGRNLNIGRG